MDAGRNALVPFCWQALRMLLLALGLHGGIAVASDFASKEPYLDLLRQRAALSRSVQLLRQETRLSRNGRPYLLLDLDAKQVILRAHGLSVKRLAVARVRELERMDHPVASAFVGRIERVSSRAVTAVAKPKPDHIVDVLDMPQVYDLMFASDEGTVRLLVRPAACTRAGKAWLNISAAVRSSTYTMMRVFGSSRPTYQLELSPEDAQALFWAIDKAWPAIMAWD